MTFYRVIYVTCCFFFLFLFCVYADDHFMLPCDLTRLLQHRHGRDGGWTATSWESTVLFL
jgi:hypothetical protein